MGMTRIDRIRNNDIRETAEDERFGDKVRGGTERINWRINWAMDVECGASRHLM